MRHDLFPHQLRTRTRRPGRPGPWPSTPSKPITLVVPFSAGGPTDKVARDLAEALHKPLGNQSIIIDNVGGAGGTLGAAKVARAAPDGYTLLLHHIGMATSPALYRKMPYDTLGDFEYLGMINDVPMTIVGKPSLPANNYVELTKWLEANKGKINLANAGLGAASHLCGLLFQSTLKIDMQTVPYKGTAPAMNDLLGGQVDLMCDQTTNTSGQIAAKSIKAYAVTSSKRLTTPALKDLPTLDEAGLKGFNVTIWHGLYAPKGTPKAVVDKINAALKVALKDPEFIKREESLGAVIINDARVNGADHKKFVAAEIAKWTPIIKANGQYADGKSERRPRSARSGGVIGIVTGPSLMRLTCMSAPNSPPATSPCSGARRCQRALVEPAAELWPGGASEARPVAARGVGGQRELADDEQAAADLRDVEVHLAGVVGEDAQPEHLGDQLVGDRPRCRRARRTRTAAAPVRRSTRPAIATRASATRCTRAITARPGRR